MKMKKDNMKRKLNNIKNHVQSKFFTVERKVRNKTARYCARLVSESPRYMTIMDVNSGDQIKMDKNTITSLKCGQFAV